MDDLANGQGGMTFYSEAEFEGREKIYNDLRDGFAQSAISSMLVFFRRGGEVDALGASKAAYKIADAMMEARKK